MRRHGTYVESTEIDGRDGEVGIKVNTFAALVRVARAVLLVIEALVTDSDQMVGVD